MCPGTRSRAPGGVDHWVGTAQEWPRAVGRVRGGTGRGTAGGRPLTGRVRGTGPERPKEGSRGQGPSRRCGGPPCTRRTPNGGPRPGAPVPVGVPQDPPRSETRCPLVPRKGERSGDRSPRDAGQQSWVTPVSAWSLAVLRVGCQGRESLGVGYCWTPVEDDGLPYPFNLNAQRLPPRTRGFGSVSLGFDRRRTFGDF